MKARLEDKVWCKGQNGLMHPLFISLDYRMTYQMETFEAAEQKYQVSVFHCSVRKTKRLNFSC